MQLEGEIVDICFTGDTAYVAALVNIRDDGSLFTWELDLKVPSHPYF